ncbi:caspase family protein [Mesorhizobium sp. VNQ89]|uniref:caspase family protein n=1 Tax=Mesorhizobium quangtriensis TaxID=3157709 RepID=UPI0032B80A8E
MALVVGNAAYEQAPLSNPLHDSQLVARALNTIGFKVTVVENATIDRLEAELKQFSDLARGADIALFYYAGHGFAVSDRGGPRNFLMGVDADVTSTSERSLRHYGLPLDDVIAAFSEAVKTTLIFVDACRNDPSITRAVGGSGRSAVAIDRSVGENVLVGLSTRLGDVAADGEPGKGSPFARAFSDNIVKAGLRVDDAFREARLAVTAETNGSQRPEIGRDDLSKPLVLVPQEEDSAAYDQAVAVGTCGAYQAFGRRYPNSYFVDLAKERAIQLCADGAVASSAATPTAPKGSEAIEPDVMLALAPDINKNDRPSPIVVRGRAIMYEERTNSVDGTATPGAAIWSEIQESPGGDNPPEPAIRAEVTIPGKDVQLRLTIKRNADKTLPTSHIIEMMFITPDGFAGGGIDNILRIAMKNAEQEAGQPLVGIPAKIADGFFLVALNDNEAEIDANMALLRDRSWIDIPVVYNTGRRALITIEKGTAGSEIVTAALDRWNGSAESLVRLKNAGVTSNGNGGPPTSSENTGAPTSTNSAGNPSNDSFLEMLFGQQ